VIFVDTGAWYAAFVPKDEDHRAARAWFQANQRQLITSDYVVDELLTLLKANDEFKRALELGRSLFGQKLARLVHVTDEDLRQAWEVFRKFEDKEWSFTDASARW
jgi:predicted nucleic acid-binding protein